MKNKKNQFNKERKDVFKEILSNLFVVAIFFIIIISFTGYFNSKSIIGVLFVCISIYLITYFLLILSIGVNKNNAIQLIFEYLTKIFGGLIVIFLFICIISLIRYRFDFIGFKGLYYILIGSSLANCYYYMIENNIAILKSKRTIKELYKLVYIIIVGPTSIIALATYLNLLKDFDLENTYRFILAIFFLIDMFVKTYTSERDKLKAKKENNN